MLRFSLKHTKRPSLITLADRARDARQWKQAAALYRKALRRNAENAPIWVQYGHALKETGHLLEAENAYRRAIAYNQNDADFHLQLGHVLKIQGKQRDAETAYLRALELDPSLDIDLFAPGSPPPVAPGGKPDPVLIGRVKEYFDEVFYLRANPDVRAAGMDPLEHFVAHGAQEQRDPSRIFDTRAYIKLYPDSLKEAKGPFFSFLKFPPKERANRLLAVASWRGPTKELPPFTYYPVANGIFLAVHEAHPTGAPLIALNLLKSIVRELRLPVVTILLNSSGVLKSDFERHSIEVIEYDSLRHACGGNPQAAWDEVARRLTRRRISHGICNSILAGQAVQGLAGRGFHCLSLVHELADSIKGFGWDRCAESIATQASMVVFPGNQVRDDFTKNFGAPRGATRVIGQPPNIPVRNTDLAGTGSTRNRIRTELGISPGDFLVLSAGAGDFRKGIDVWLKTIKDVCGRSENGAKRIKFAWLGEVLPHYLIWIKKDLRQWDCDEQVVFLGAHLDDVADYFMAADIFFLPSREDPFPTVVIEALHFGLPVIGFEGTGGLSEQIGDRAGVLAPYGDCAKAADLILQMASSDLRWIKNAAFDRARSFSTPDSYAADLLNLLQFQVTHKERLSERRRSPLVGVGVPAYQCQDHVEERLWSIFEQSVVPAEVFVVDDASVDGTVEAIDRLKVFAPCPFRVKVNERNSGSPFPQWQRCLEEMNTDFVWIAESDDGARLNFIEIMEPFVRDNASINLAYAKSATMDGYSQEYREGHQVHLRSIGRLSRWEESYVRSGNDEIAEVLAFENSIPNISACLIHRESALPALKAATRYKAVGDWVFYISLLKGGMVAYCHEQLNLHRRHPTSIISRLESQPIFHVERAGAHLKALTSANLDAAAVERMIRNQDAAFERLMADSPTIVDRSYLDLMQRSLRDIVSEQGTGHRRRILVILPDLHVGGGQLAGVRLANALAAAHYVWIYVVDRSQTDSSIVDRIDPWACILPEGGFEFLTSFLEAAQIEMVSSHVWWSDKLAFGLKQACPDVKWLITMHGCYERILKEPDIDPWFSKNAGKLLDTADGVIYLADKNLAVFNEFGIAIDPARVRKVYNGVSVPKALCETVRQRQLARRVARSFVLVGRGIEEKGWREAAEALVQVNSRLANEGHAQVELTFVGSGEFLSKLESELASTNAAIQFLGPVSDVFAVLKEMDVGLLPSFFPQESLPTVLIEYLVCGLPAIVTEIGETRQMLTFDGCEAGTIIGFERGRADVRALADAMYRYATNPDIFAEHGRRAALAMGKFTMENMFRAYSEVIGMRLTNGDDADTMETNSDTVSGRSVAAA